MSTATQVTPQQAAEKPQREQLPVAVPRERLVVSDASSDANLLDTARFEQIQRIAGVMAIASLVPDHLKAKMPHIADPEQRANAEYRATCGNCVLVVNQAMRWGADPFAVAAESYVVGNKLGYQGKLVAAIVNTRAGLQKRLLPTYTGEGDNRTVTIHGKFADEAEERTITLAVRQAKTANKIWQTDPDQKLFYSGVTKWARRHCPEVLLGILTEDDVERIADNMDVHYGSVPHDAPALPSRADDLAARLKRSTPMPESGQSTDPHEAAAQVAAAEVAAGPAGTTPTVADSDALAKSEMQAADYQSFIDLCVEAKSVEQLGALKARAMADELLTDYGRTRVIAAVAKALDRLTPKAQGQAKPRGQRGMFPTAPHATEG